MRDSKGQTLVLVAIAMVVLLGMAALALDGGHVYLQRRQMQTAADAAALAAARTICLEPTADWVEVGNSYCLSNGADDDGSGNPCDVRAGSVERSAKATAPEAVNTWLASIVGPGLDVVDVAAEAEASCRNLSAAWSLIPLTVPEEDFEIGATYLVKTELHIEGSFKWLDWDAGGGGANELIDRINDPSADVISINDLVAGPTEPGQMQTALRALWDRWQCQEIVVPIYDYYLEDAPGTNRVYHISGFAAFKLTGSCWPGNGDGVCPGYTQPHCSGPERKIEGEFVRYVHLDGYSGGADDTGVYMINLTQ